VIVVKGKRPGDKKLLRLNYPSNIYHGFSGEMETHILLHVWRQSFVLELVGLGLKMEEKF
jgi:hypothetical protein